MRCIARTFLLGILAIAISAAVESYFIATRAYQRVDLKALGYFNFDQSLGTRSDIPWRCQFLDGKRIRVEGFMFSRNAATRLHDFQLIYNFPQHFQPPLVQERIFAKCGTAKTVPYVSDYVVAYGTLHVNVKRDAAGVITSVYEMDVDHVDNVVDAPSLAASLDSYFGYNVPLPVTAALAVLLTLLTAIVGCYHLIRALLRLRRPTSGFCVKCGYDLRASIGRCPECGTEIHWKNLPPASIPPVAAP